MSFFSQKQQDQEGLGKGKQWALLSQNEVDQSIIQSRKDPEDQLLTFTLYKYRFFNVVVFVISALGNNLIVQTTTPITTQLEKLYPDYGSEMISLCSLIFYIMHPPMAFVSNYIIETKGLKFGISLGAVTMIIGTGIRCFVKSGFWWVILGQFINALGNCFITNSPSKVAANWFQPRHRPAVTAISTFAVLASGALGLVIPAIFVSAKNSTEDDVFDLMLAEFIMIGAIMAFNLVCFRGEPPSPPRNYLFLLGFMTLLLGTVNAYVSTMSLLMSPFDFLSGDVSQVGVYSIAFGFFGSIVGATVLKKTRKYYPIMLIGTLFASVCFFIELVCISQGEASGYKFIAFLMSGFTGFFVYPVFSTALEFGCEIAYPAGEASVAGFLLAGSQVFGFGLGLIMASVLDGKSQSRSYIGGITYMVCVILSVIPLSFTKQDLRRSKFEIQGTLNENPIINEHLEQEIKREYVVDNEASKIVQDEIKKRTLIQ